MADAHECLHHHSHHLVKEPISFELDGDASTSAPQTDGANDSNSVGFGRSPVRRKRNEIVFAAKFFGRADHLIEVERTHNMPGAIIFKWRKHSCIPDAVAIGFSFCGKSRMECVGNKSALHHANG